MRPTLKSETLSRAFCGSVATILLLLGMTVHVYAAEYALSPDYDRLRCVLLPDVGTLQRLIKRTHWREISIAQEERKIKRAIKKLRRIKQATTSSLQRASTRQKIATLRNRRQWMRDCIEGKLTNGDSVEDPEPTPPPQDHIPVITDCTDGIDNDRDSWTDSEDSDCATSGKETRIARNACEDGIDNDGDGHVDNADNGCDSDRDLSERGIEGECSDGLDNDDDGIADYPFDRGCSSPSALEQSSDDDTPHVAVSMGSAQWLRWPDMQLMEAPGAIESVFWNDPSDGLDEWREVLGYLPDRRLDEMTGNPTRFFLHSAIRLIDDSGGHGWRFGSAPQSLGAPVPHSAIQYSELPGEVIEASDSHNLQIQSSVVAALDSVAINAKVTNISNEERFYEIPVYVPYILFPEHDGTIRLRGEAGGSISRNFSQGTSWEYPGVNSFSPVVALWQEPDGLDPRFTVGISLVTPLARPDAVTFEELNRFVYIRVLLKLAPGESKNVGLTVGIAPSGEWAAALSDYKRVFQYHHGGTPSYCPPGALVTASGANTGYYDHQAKRFLPGTLLRDLFPPERLEFMTNWFQFAGFWETAIDSRYASPARPVNKESWVHLFDPNIEFGPDGNLGGYINQFTQQNVEVLWFTRPNFGLDGYRAESDGQGGYNFTPGRVLDLDYTYAADRDTYLSYLEPLAAAGVTAFYVDAFDAPGGPAYVHFVAQELEARYGRKVTMIVEGIRDLYANVSAQIPIISNGSFEGSDPKFGALVPWLTPYVTMYGGRINATLDPENIEHFVAQGPQNQPVPLDGFPVTLSRQFCRWINQAYLNRTELFQSYGASLLQGGVPKCSPPQAPPVSIDDCDDLPSFTGW